MRIAMPKGDIRWVRFIVKIPEGVVTEIDFTSIYFTVKKTSKDHDYLFQKSLKRGNLYRINAGDYQFKIDQEDTRDLSVGEYKFDIQLSYKNLLKETFVGDFVLKDEVTYYENEEGDDGETDFTLPMTSEKTAFILSIPDYHVIELTTPVNVNEEGNVESLTDIELDIITRTASSKASALVLLNEGGEMFFSSDIEMDESISIKRDITIDFVNHKLSFLEDSHLIINGATVRIKNGNIEAVESAIQVINGGELIIESGVYTSYGITFVVDGVMSRIELSDGVVNGVRGGIYLSNKAEAEINGGSIIASNGPAVFTDSTDSHGHNTLTVNNGILTSKTESNRYQSCGIYIANNDTVVINDGEITAENGCGLLMRGGNITINGGLITATGQQGTVGRIGDSNVYHNKSAVIYHESANYPGKIGMKLVINSGKFVGVDYSVQILSNESTPNVSFFGGNYYPSLS